MFKYSRAGSEIILRRTACFGTGQCLDLKHVFGKTRAEGKDFQGRSAPESRQRNADDGRLNARVRGQMRDLDGMGEMGRLTGIHGNIQTITGPAGVGKMRTELHQKQGRWFGRGMPPVDFRQTANFLEEPHQFIFGSHIKSGICIAKDVPVENFPGSFAGPRKQPGVPGMNGMQIRRLRRQNGQGGYHARPLMRSITERGLQPASR